MPDERVHRIVQLDRNIQKWITETMTGLLLLLKLRIIMTKMYEIDSYYSYYYSVSGYWVQRWYIFCEV